MLGKKKNLPLWLRYKNELVELFHRDKMSFIHHFYSAQTFLQLKLLAQMLNILSESMFYWEWFSVLFTRQDDSTNSLSCGGRASICVQGDMKFLNTFVWKAGGRVLWVWVTSHQPQTIPSQLKLPQRHCNRIQGAMETSCFGTAPRRDIQKPSWHCLTAFQLSSTKLIQIIVFTTEWSFWLQFHNDMMVYGGVL